LRWHYFTDTVAGAAVGAGTVCALALLLDLGSAAARGNPEPRRQAPARGSSQPVGSLPPGAED
jgi:hypothetical protein